MQFLIKNRALAVLLAVVQFGVSVGLAVPSTVLAQAADPEPPVIAFERIAEGVLGDTQVFTATVTDNISVEGVILHYRLVESAPYQSLSMAPIASTDIYTASVATSVSDNTLSIQYYIEATDGSGNRTLQGFSFDPIERNLVERAGNVATAAPTGPVESMSTSRKILYGFLGVVIVGALAAAAGGSDSGGGSVGASGPDVPVTVIVDQLP